MGRKRKPLPFIENVTIEAVAAEGKCITRVDDQVIFVPFCVPGDVVDLQVVKKKHKYCEAKVVRFIKKSDVRQEPMCELLSEEVVRVLLQQMAEPAIRRANQGKAETGGRPAHPHRQD